MSTSRSILFFAEKRNPAIIKVINFIKESGECQFSTHDCYRYPGGSWIPNKPNYFPVEYFGIRSIPSFKGLKCYFYIGSTNSVFNSDKGGRCYYNSPLFNKIAKHLSIEERLSIKILVLRNEERQRPKWLSVWNK